LKTIAIGCDHAGVDHKNYLVKKIKKLGYLVDDKGTYSNTSVDYPDFAHPVATDVETGKAIFGVLICGSANGVCMTANKHQGIRAALCWNIEVAEVVRLHNDANIICIPARFASKILAGRMLEKFLNTSFEGGRHQKRIDKISC
jgi:ribose 5-phosphate isomerase B